MTLTLHERAALARYHRDLAAEQADAAEQANHAADRWQARANRRPSHNAARLQALADERRVAAARHGLAADHHYAAADRAEEADLDD